jgi:PIF1-like helicase
MLKIPCHTECYHSHDTIKEQDEADFHLPVGAEDDLLATMQEPGVPPTTLSLKMGCITNIMRNMSIEDSLVKNARVQVVSLQPNVVQVWLL